MIKNIIVGLLGSVASAHAQALFISPVGGEANQGDVVIPSDPRLVIVADGLPERPVAEFSRASGLNVVLQPGLPDDGDVHPVGYFQATWRSEAPGRYTARVVLPDGRTVATLAIVLAETRRVLRTLNLAGAHGDVVGGMKFRFRIDAPTVDRDGDGVLDWYDNCPDVANANQADRNDDGAGDACGPDLCNDRGPGFVFDPATGACQCAEVFECVPPAVFDEDTCVCACPSCGEGHVLLDAVACTCGCPQLEDPSPCDQPNHVFNPTTCACECPVEQITCPPGTVIDAKSCGCVCDASLCGKAQVQDPDTCLCACPQDDLLEPCDQLNHVFNPTTCACECPVEQITCPADYVLNADTCQCEPRPCGPGLVRTPRGTCECPAQVQCPFGQVLDPVKCTCACGPVLCAEGQVVDPDTCGCMCAVTLPCGEHEIFDPNTCACEQVPQ